MATKTTTENFKTSVNTTNLTFDLGKIGVLEYYIHGSITDVYDKFEKLIKSLLMVGQSCECELITKRKKRKRPHHRQCHHHPQHRYLLPWNECVEIWKLEGISLPYYGGYIEIYLTFSNYPGYYIHYRGFGGVMPTSWLRWKLSRRTFNYRMIVGPCGIP